MISTLSLYIPVYDTAVSGWSNFGPYPGIRPTVVSCVPLGYRYVPGSDRRGASRIHDTVFKALAQRSGQLSRHGFNDISLVTQDYCHSKTTIAAALSVGAARTTIRSLQPHGASSNGIVLHGCLGRFAGVWHIHHAANVVPGVIVSRTGRREAGQLPHVAWSAILTSPHGYGSYGYFSIAAA